MVSMLAPTAIITDANGCSLTLEFTLDQPMDLVMPTGYTPNNDGSNDQYVVHGLEAFKENHITIFNRLGQRGVRPYELRQRLGG